MKFAHTSGLFFLFAVIVCCSSNDQHHENFVGLWVVDQPAHALYEATLYDFKRDGEIENVETVTSLGGLSGFVTGTVSHPTRPDCNSRPCTWSDSDITCRFGNRWHSYGHERLAISGDCTDGQSREILFQVSQKTGFYVDVTLISVGGEKEWLHMGDGWAFWRCSESRTECLRGWKK